jgi:hypothetical protein
MTGCERGKEGCEVTALSLAHAAIKVANWVDVRECLDAVGACDSDAAGRLFDIVLAGAVRSCKGRILR